MSKRFYFVMAAAALAGIWAATTSASTADIPHGDLAITGYLNVSDNSTNDSVFAALAVTRAGVPVRGLRVTVNGTMLAEAASAHNYQGVAALPDLSAGSGVRIEVVEPAAIAPAVHGPTVLATASGTLPGVVRFAKPVFPPPPPPAILDPKVSFAWSFAGDMAAPVDVLVYELPGERLVFESRGWGRDAIQVRSALFAAGRSYSFTVLKPLHELKVSGLHVAAVSAVGFRYIARLDVAIPRR